MSGAPVFISGALVYVAAAQEIPLKCLALVARGACVPGSHGTVAIGETVPRRLPSLGYCTHSRLKQTPSLSLKEAYLFVLEFWLCGGGEGCLQVR